MGLFRVLVCAVVALGVSCFALSRSAAQETAQGTTEAADAEVQAVLVEAVREYEAGNYEEAYALFLRVHGLRPTARTERALGKTAFGLRRYVEAVRWLSASLEDARQPLTDEMRTEVEGFLLRARSFLGHFTLRVTPAIATVEIDGVPHAESTTDLEIGDHEIVVRAADHETVTRRVAVRGGEDDVIEITLVAQSAQTIVVTAAPDPGGTQRDLGWASIITGGVLVAGGAVATILWSDAVASLNANIDRGACSADASESVVAGPPICYEQQNRYRLALPLQWVGYAAGATLVGVGIALLASAPTSAETDRALSCSPGLLGLTCRGTF